MKKLLIILPILLSMSLMAQKKEGIHRGLVRVQGTVGLGISKPELRYYFIGELEGCVSDHIGINGTTYTNFGSDRSAFDIYTVKPKADDFYVHSVLTGPIYHFLTDQPLDVYVGIQPGLSLTQFNYLNRAGAVQTEWGVAPTTSALTGVAYYGSFFHLFAQARYVATRHATLVDNRPLRDLRLAIGLGFNIN
jgi:hypothetical protein